MSGVGMSRAGSQETLARRTTIRRPNKNGYVLSLSSFDYIRQKSGVPKAIMADQQMTNAVGASYVYLWVWQKRVCGGRLALPCVYRMVIDGEEQEFCSLAEVFVTLASWSRQGVKPLELHIHHLLETDLRDIDTLLCHVPEIPIRVYAHDYYLCCTSLNLMKQGGFCHATHLGDEPCQTCHWYSQSCATECEVWKLLRKHQTRITFVVPSNDVKRRFCTFHPKVSELVHVVPHQVMIGQYAGNREPITSGQTIKIAFLGWPAAHKGWRVWMHLQPLFRRMGYAPYIFNSSDDQYEGMIHVKVSFDAEHPDAMVDALRSQGIHMAILYTSCPETYSYTCMESYSSNVFVLTSACSGNIADFVREHRSGLAFDSREELMLFLENRERVVLLLNRFRANSSPPEKLVSNDEISKLKPTTGVNVEPLHQKRFTPLACLWLTFVNSGAYKKYRKKKEERMHRSVEDSTGGMA